MDWLRAKLPDAEPYRGWATFTVTRQSGRVNEHDALIVTPAGLFLLELKAHPGELRNHGRTWQFYDAEQGGRARTIENPLHLTDLKAKELKGLLQWAVTELGGRRESVPYINSAVFLTGERLVSRLDAQQSPGVYGRDDRPGSNLPPIWRALLDAAPRDERQRREVFTFSEELPELMRKIGAISTQTRVEVGRFELDPNPLDVGPNWFDALGRDPQMRGDERRVRIYTSRMGETPEARKRTARAARREYMLLRGIGHEGIARALDFESVDAGSAVVFAHRESDLRLDQYLDVYGAQLTLEQRLGLVRKLGEALHYAHRRHLFHRGLAARNIYVSHEDGRNPRPRIAGWQFAAYTASTDGTSAMTGGGSATATNLAEQPIDSSPRVYLAPEFIKADEADPATMDVFGFGSVAYLIVTGRPPAEDRGQLAQTLARDGGLRVAALLDSVPEELDDLVHGATRVLQSDRIPDLPAFLAGLDAVDEALSRRDETPEPDPLLVKAGQVIAQQWRVDKVLGTGATARALLVRRIDPQAPDPSASDAEVGRSSASANRRVFKVALDQEKAARLHEEASVLATLRSANIVELLEGPFTVGERTVLALEQAGDVSLAQYLSAEGRCTFEELRRFGRHLFAALEHLEGKAVWHRDIKPDNLGVRKQRNGGKELVLFDFSLAHARRDDLKAGTPAYLDPFLTRPRRPEYDEHAEWFAAAVTLHEMASGTLPTWGDGVVDAEFITDELPSIAVEAFDASLRDGLTAFFTRALHRDIDERFATLDQMRAAWEQLFLDAEAQRPGSIGQASVTAADAGSDGTDADDETTALSLKEARDQAAATARPTTTLADAGLSPGALEAAAKLGAQTVAELVSANSKAIWNLRGIGRTVRTELLQRAKQWKPLISVGERQPSGTQATAGTGDCTDQIRWNLDEIREHLLAPAKPGQKGSNRPAIITLMLGLPAAGHALAVGTVWPTTVEVAKAIGIKPPSVSIAMKSTRDAWFDSERIADVRGFVVNRLTEGARIAEVRQLAADLEAGYGSMSADPAERRALALAALRAAVEVETKSEDEPRFAESRTRDRVLIALESADDSQPSARELSDYVNALARRADELAAADPLPGPGTVAQRLRSIPAPDGMTAPGLTALSDAWLIQTATAASAQTAATARGELYPVNLPLDRALRLSLSALGAGLGLFAALDGESEPEGLTVDQVLQRVRTRLPELAHLTPERVAFPQLRDALKAAGSDLEYVQGLFRRPRIVSDGVTASPSSRFSRRGRSSASRSVGGSAITPTAKVEDRLLGSRKRGGFLAVNVRRADTLRAIEYFTGAADDGVVPFDIGARFVEAAKNAAQAMNLQWADVLTVDAESDARGQWHPGLRQLVAGVWQTLRGDVERLVGAEDTLFAYNPGVLARYPGGPEWLAALQSQSRDADSVPGALWLLVPSAAPSERPRISGMGGPGNANGLLVEVVTENEWFELATDVLRTLEG